MTDTQMDLLKAAVEWTKAEMVSSAFFAAAGIVFLLASYGFWQLGKTDMAKAFIIPFLVVGTLLVIPGVGLIIPNQLRLTNIPGAITTDSATFIATEIARVDKTMAGYSNAVFRVIPLIIVVSAVMFMLLNAPIWRASLIAVIAMMAVIVIVDTNANARLADYKTQLRMTQQRL